MPSFEDPAADAVEAEQALRGLAHATRRDAIDDPAQIYDVLGSLTQAVASLSQSLHRIGSFHDQRIRDTTRDIGDAPQAGATYRASWDLHLAGEMLNAVGKSIANAHNASVELAMLTRFAKTALRLRCASARVPPTADTRRSWPSSPRYRVRART